MILSLQPRCGQDHTPSEGSGGASVLCLSPSFQWAFAVARSRRTGASQSRKSDDIIATSLRPLFSIN
ncbi:unnamed protein product [Nyctereutes procyonoides]|uniref:(raccoon dog) hypothetical protein n=1 Tax=Nyctereutes procyonoides TaxID=34880 RepID=A0A811YW35_NYCPR|nr:unnamed protein product [Nyctereutes procyonoides]